ncbi:MAG: bifunctional phosphopantothenoylcysteine decarboxylase/phosphopantothenate--cysteine ligase CoaBC [candidate division Zixibacteria bacterium]|nr:bifunctional phosphopantothenoylcysteine decarboxylase/phosphopantothenate--cysteine ligase CoaBC [candidate division Zixibacteria bacterium]
MAGDQDKKHVLLGVTGGIAAYKSAELTRLFVKAGHEVKVIMTGSACEFITPLTLATLSNNDVAIEMFPESGEFTTRHIDLADWADILVIAPATANFIGKAANGICDDLLTTVFPAATCPVLIAPAMNSNMWDYPAVQENFLKLLSYGFYSVGPDSGDLACGWVGRGRMVEPETIFLKALSILSLSGRLMGKKVLVSASRTEEPIDSVRYISNRSSGKMGYALALEAKAEGADVVLVSGPSGLTAPRGIEMVRVTTAVEMAEAVKKRFDESDVVIMSAAVSDYAPSNPPASKIKKTEAALHLDLDSTEDILRSLGEMKKKQVLVGFALETDNAVDNAIKKLESKNLDFIVLNNPNESGAGFDTDTNRVDIISRGGRVDELPLMSKREVAAEIITRIVKLLNSM